MEQLRTELSHLLGEKLSRVECVSEQAATALWFLYDAQGNPMPLLARSFTTPGVARQLAWKISTLARNGTVRMPVVYGVMTHEEHPGPDVLLLERLRGVPVEARRAPPARWEQCRSKSSRRCWRGIGRTVAAAWEWSTIPQENLWPNWYRQRVEILWSTLNLYQDTGLTMQDKRLLFRSRECLPELFRDFNDNAVLVHGNFTLRSMLKDPRSDQLLAMVGPGMMLWAPREYELFRLAEGGQAEQLLWRYLQQAPVSEAFVWRRWLYLLWDEVDSLVNTGRFDRARFDLAAKSLLPWLA